MYTPQTPAKTMAHVGVADRGCGFEILDIREATWDLEQAEGGSK